MTEPAKVLIADDEALFRDTTADLLSAAGYACTCVKDAPEAARLLAEQPFDLLISDIKMPGNAHLQLVLEAREIAAGMPIILVTGYPSVETAVQAVRLPVSAYLLKPVDIDDLLPLVEQCVARGRLLRIINSSRARMQNWRADLDQLAEALSGPAKVPLAEPAGALLGGIFETLIKSLGDMGSALTTLHATENVVRPSGLSLMEGRLAVVKRTLQEAIQVLEQSKHVFKSKRLGELRKQFVDLLENLDGQENILASPKT